MQKSAANEVITCVHEGILKHGTCNNRQRAKCLFECDFEQVVKNIVMLYLELQYDEMDSTATHN
jgi:hypothetical protein